MRYLHSMLRVTDLKKTVDFFCRTLGFIETHRKESEGGRYTLVFLATKEDAAKMHPTQRPSPTIELTYNWDKKAYQSGDTFGHLAYEVDNLYQLCERIQQHGYTINRPPRDGHMAFIKTPDGISLELIQKAEKLAPTEPWISMPNVGQW